MQKWHNDRISEQDYFIRETRINIMLKRNIERYLKKWNQTPRDQDKYMSD